MLVEFAFYRIKWVAAPPEVKLDIKSISTKGSLNWYYFINIRIYRGPTILDPKMNNIGIPFFQFRQYHTYLSCLSYIFDWGPPSGKPLIIVSSGLPK